MKQKGSTSTYTHYLLHKTTLLCAAAALEFFFLAPFLIDLCAGSHLYFVLRDGCSCCASPFESRRHSCTLVHGGSRGIVVAVIQMLYADMCTRFEHRLLQIAR